MNPGAKALQNSLIKQTVGLYCTLILLGEIYAQYTQKDVESGYGVLESFLIAHAYSYMRGFSSDTMVAFLPSPIALLNVMPSIAGFSNRTVLLLSVALDSLYLLQSNDVTLADGARACLNQGQETQIARPTF